MQERFPSRSGAYVQRPARPWPSLRRVPIAGVPRNFNTGRMLVIVTLFAILFSLLQLTGAPSIMYPATGIFIAAILAGQMLLFGGRQPRLASCIVGTTTMPMIIFVCLYIAVGPRRMGSLQCVLLSSAIFGLTVGYLVGTICAGVFLIVDRNWHAGMLVHEEPVDAEIVGEGETQQGRPQSGGLAERDPWSAP